MKRNKIVKMLGLGLIFMSFFLVPVPSYAQRITIDAGDFADGQLVTDAVGGVKIRSWAEGAPDEFSSIHAKLHTGINDHVFGYPLSGSSYRLFWGEKGTNAFRVDFEDPTDWVSFGMTSDGTSFFTPTGIIQLYDEWGTLLYTRSGLSVPEGSVADHEIERVEREISYAVVFAERDSVLSVTSFGFNTLPVPEPSTFLFLGLGMLPLFMRCRGRLAKHSTRS